MMKIELLCNHGDPHYIGLNGIQVLDKHGEIIEINEDQLQATPYRLMRGHSLCAAIDMIYFYYMFYMSRLCD